MWAGHGLPALCRMHGPAGAGTGQAAQWGPMRSSSQESLQRKLRLDRDLEAKERELSEGAEARDTGM